jgi:hypothetical protein
MDSPFIAEDNWSHDDSKYTSFTKEMQGSVHSRYSTCMNDDNYDYAIELKLDDEYRQAADALPNISELDIDDDHLLVLLDKHTSFPTRRVTLSSAIEHGKIKEYIRQSLSLSPNRRSEDSIVNEVPSPLQSPDCHDIEEGFDNDNDNENDRDENEFETIPLTTPNHHSPLQPLSATRVTPLRSPLPAKPKNTDLFSYSVYKTWSLSGVWNATVKTIRPVSQRIMAAGADIINREPLNPVTALFEPPTMINKSAKRMINNFGGKKEKLRMATPNNTNNNADGLTPLPPAQFLGWTSPGTQIWARLKMAGLDVKCVFSWDLRYICMYIYMYIYKYIYIHICMYICMYICIYINIYIYTYIYVYMYICIHIYIYKYICMHIYIYIFV